jgi:chorismate lyase/3-hydroxybenzoate synthase
MQQQGSSIFRYHELPLPLCVEPAVVTDLPALLLRDDVLMAVDFSGKTGFERQDPRLVHAGLRALGNSPDVEVWFGSGEVTCHQQGRIGWCENGDVLFGHLLVEDASADNLGDLVASAYTEINAFLQASAYPCAFRFWHYIPGINQVENGIERYQAFCSGRHSAVSLQRDFERTLAAASAVGTDVPGLLISFASGKIRPLQVENPRQVSAFHYPPVYGPCSPLFSRAICMNWNVTGQQLFLSGTASIVGHETRHADDVVAQTRETCRNIDAVLEGFSTCLDKADTHRVSASCLRVYLRHPGDLDRVSGILDSKPGLPENIIYLQGDLCREELLLEIEGVFTPAGSAVHG